jgi:hypothetical protein
VPNENTFPLWFNAIEKENPEDICLVLFNAVTNVGEYLIIKSPNPSCPAFNYF